MDFANYWFSSGSGGGGGGHPIGNSLRFRGSSRMTRTQKEDNRSNWTFSVWAKLGQIPDLNRTPTAFTGRPFIGVEQPGGNDWTYCGYWAGQFSVCYGCVHCGGDRPCGSEAQGIVRDLGGWYHVVYSHNSSRSPRTRIWVNGVERTQVTWTEMTPGNWNRGGAPMYFGATSTMHLINGQWYAAEAHYISGTAVNDPNTFGFRTTAGIWVPAEVNLTQAEYGANGFYMDFSDPNNIGADRSGNGNNFAPTGFQLSDTGSSEYDLMQDSPTNNYPLIDQLPQGSQTFSEAGMRVSAPNGSRTPPATLPLPRTGKYYVEYEQISGTGGYGFGVVQGTAQPGLNFNIGIQYRPNGETFLNGSRVLNAGWGTTFMGLQIDMDANTVQAYKQDGSSYGSTYTLTANQDYVIYCAGGGGGVTQNNRMNFGQRPWRRNPASGFEAPCTENRPSPSLPATVTGTFTGNSNADGPVVYTGCLPGRIQYGSVNVTYGNRLGQSNVDFLANGFKVRSTTSNSGTVSYTVTTTHSDGEYNGHQVPSGGDGVPPAPACSN